MSLFFSVLLATPYVTADAGHLGVDSGWFSGQVFAGLVEPGMRVVQDDAVSAVACSRSIRWMVVRDTR